MISNQFVSRIALKTELIASFDSYPLSLGFKAEGGTRIFRLKALRKSRRQ